MSDLNYRFGGREMFWCTPIYYFDLKNSEQINNKLKKLIFDWKREDKGIVRSNSFGWHSPADMELKEEFKFFVDELDTMKNKIFSTEEYKSGTELFFDGMWANVSQKYAYNIYHKHPGSLWSGVYYVQSPPNCGNIVFKVLEFLNRTPSYEKESGDRQPHQWDTVNYDPIEGRAIFFPSWVGHEVEQNLTNVEGDDGNRISISFNINQRKGKVDV